MRFASTSSPWTPGLPLWRLLWSDNWSRPIRLCKEFIKSHTPARQSLNTSHSHRREPPVHGPSLSFPRRDPSLLKEQKNIFLTLTHYAAVSISFQCLRTHNKSDHHFLLRPSPGSPDNRFRRTHTVTRVCKAIPHQPWHNPHSQSFLLSRTLATPFVFFSPPLRTMSVHTRRHGLRPVPSAPSFRGSRRYRS